MIFDFATAGHIVFGAGTINRAGELTAPLGLRAFLVTGSHPERAEALRVVLRDAGITWESFAVGREPDADVVARGAEAARAAGAQVVIGFGGGSVLDTAKAIAALATNTAPVLDYVEVVGKGRPLENAPLPVVAIPTTSGTGSEATRNAVISFPERRVKVSLRHAGMLPRVALVDPDLTAGLPRSVAASTGLDALTQLIEGYTSCKATPFTHALCQEALPRAVRGMERLARGELDAEGRADLAFASLTSGVVLANAGLGVVHGLAGPLGGFLEAPHGALCAALLPGAVEANVAALRSRAPSHPALARYAEISALFGGEAPERLREWNGACGIPFLRNYKLAEADLPVLVAQAGKSSSMKGNPIPLEDSEIEGVLRAAI
jgi:alcohol dehydrogenase class IV